MADQTTKNGAMGDAPTSGPAPVRVEHHHYHPYRKFYRARSEKWLGGICGGLGLYFGRDPLLIRVAWVILTIISFGAGLIAYAILWIFVEKEPEAAPRPAAQGASGKVEHHHYHG